MNRREAIAALMALPVATVKTATVAPADVIVFETPEHVSSQARQLIAAQAEKIWPGHRVVVLSAGLTMKVYRNGQLPIVPPNREVRDW